MPILTPPLPSAAEVRSLCESDETAMAQGPEGHQVRRQIAEVQEHWRLQSLGTKTEMSVDLLDELNGYRHVPFERVGTRRVKYVRIERLKPRKIDVDENER